MRIPDGISNIIFDLGEVIIDLDIPGTVRRFADRSGKSEQQVREIYTASDVFLNYEKGLISDQDFRDGANRLFGTDMADDEIDSIWNSMLRHLPERRLELLDRLKSGYRTFLLSNTNAIHIRAFHAHMPGTRSLESYFEKVYFSHVMNKRKPDAEIFEQVLQENGLKPEKTLFLDDNADNIRGAAACGIVAVRVVHPDDILKLIP